MQSRKRKLMALADQIEVQWEIIENSQNSIEVSGKPETANWFYQSAKEDYEHWVREYHLFCVKTLKIEERMRQIKECDGRESEEMVRYHVELEILLKNYEKTGVFLEVIADDLLLYFDRVPKI